MVVYKEYDVVVLLGHNAKKGKKKAPDEIRKVIATSVIDAYTLAQANEPGVKKVIEVREGKTFQEMCQI